MSDYRTYMIRVEKGRTPAGGTIEVLCGCDGVNHAESPAEVFRDEEGEVIGAGLCPVEDKGPCDKTCTSDDLGGFLHPVPA